MKVITFNQLQLRLLTFLFFLFTTSVFSYRYFIELPKLEQSIAKLSEREIDTLKFNIARKLDILSRTSFDYAVWTSTYDFIRSRDQDYIEENIVENTFVSLKIDGIFYLDEHLKIIFAEGFHRAKSTKVIFSFYNFGKYPKNLSLLPTVTLETGAPKQSGFINTLHGPAIFASTQIRDSNMNGEFRGFLVMVQLLGKEFVEELSTNTLTNISYQSIPSTEALLKLQNWNEKPQTIEIMPYRDIILSDSTGEPVSVLRMKHSVGKVPDLLNEQSFIFIILMSLLIYLVYRLVSIAIIDPVKKLADDLKERDNSHQYTPLEGEYMVAELATVSKNVNALMATVQQQNDILSKQANTDQLTKVLNRRGLIRAMEFQKRLCIRNRIGFVVIMTDIDHFKLYNDSVGHLEGDRALIKVANALNLQCQRVSDICARYGGEEFTLLFSDIEGHDLDKKLNDIMQVMQDLALVHPSSPTAKHITVSMGVAIIKASDVVDFTLSINNIFSVADSALYEAKHAGRNCFVVKNISSGQ